MNSINDDSIKSKWLALKGSIKMQNIGFETKVKT